MTPRCEKDGKRSRRHNWGEWGEMQKAERTGGFAALAEPTKIATLVQFRFCATCRLRQVSEVQAP